MLLIGLIIATTWLLSLFLPWWSLAIPCLVLGGWLGEKGGQSFLYGFLGIGLLWFIQTLVIHIFNEGILTTRIAELFSLPHPLLVMGITVIIGGLAGGFSTLTGYLFKQAFFSKRATY